MIRKVGERWEESFGKETIYWEQMNGYRKRSTTPWDMQEVWDDLRSYTTTFAKCPKDNCTCIQPNPLDEKFRKKMGMCFDCVTKLELKMQLDGDFDQYAKKKMYENVKAYIKDLDSEMATWKKDVSGKIEFANGDSTIETWSSTDSTAMIKRMDDEYMAMRETLLSNYDPDKKGM